MDWEDTATGDDVYYIVEQKRKRFRVFGDWEPLPFDGFKVNGTSSKTYKITESQVTISGLEFNKDYQYHVATVVGDDDDDISAWSRTYDVHTPLPFLGIQADHTVRYTHEPDQIPSPTGYTPPGYDLRNIFSIALSGAVSKWNSSRVATSGPRVLICGGGGACPSSREDDLRSHAVVVGENLCRPGAACLASGGLSSYSAMADFRGYMNGGQIRIEEPASTLFKNRAEVRTFWTLNPSLHAKPVIRDSDRHWIYLPQTLMHEFGHALGLHDLYRFGSYPNYIMGSNDKPNPFQNIPSTDLTYLEEVYRNSTPRSLP